MGLRMWRRMACHRTGRHEHLPTAINLNTATYHEMSWTIPIPIEKVQDVRSRPRLAASVVVEGEEKLESTTCCHCSLECKILLTVRHDKRRAIAASATENPPLVWPWFLPAVAQYSAQRHLCSCSLPTGCPWTSHRLCMRHCCQPMFISPSSALRRFSHVAYYDMRKNRLRLRSVKKRRQSQQKEAKGEHNE